MKIFCDESVWVPVADGLRQRGWTVFTASEEGRLGLTDAEQLRFASENGYVLLTFDDDFLSLVDGRDADHAGVIYVNQSGRRIGDVVKEVDRLLEEEVDEEIRYL